VDVRIRFVLRIVEERAGALDLSSKQLGGLLGLGEARLLRLFSSEVGKAFRSHLREVRMTRAAEMLTNFALPIKTISSRCGYSTVSNFHRDFKMVHGTSPMQMRLLKMGLNTTSDQMNLVVCSQDRLLADRRPAVM
jgi:AraC-like DNA-binding protein